jgi:hydroxymethylpyrimidine pyrophosphatase-like HAD family hydrolase
MMGLDARDFVAIGDSPNDIEMIKAAGLGVAVEEVLGELRKRGEIR